MNWNSVKYTIKIFLLIAIITYVVDKVVFVVLNTLSDEVYTGQRIGKLNQFLQKKDGLEFIVFGSSRANHHVDPSKLSKNSFNMGLDGRKLAFSAALIKLLPHNKKQTILLHIDPENAFDQSYTGDDILALTSKYNRENIIKQEMDKLKQNNILQNYFWSLGYNRSVLGILKNYFIPDNSSENYYGYDPIRVSNNQREIFKNILKKDEEEINCEDNLVLNRIYDDYLRELNQFCKENGKNLILFTSPIFSDICKDDNIALSLILKNKNLEYYDLTDFFKENNDIEYWKDKGHLSNLGAELFTEKIRLLISRGQ